MKDVKRGFVEKDIIWFGSEWKDRMSNAGEELFYLLNRGYDLKTASTFIGNHYLLSERQRLALARMVSSQNSLTSRQKRELRPNALLNHVYIDGFNTIITLEVALSGSLLLKGMDGAIRDLAGLRGTYRIVDKTWRALTLLLKRMDHLGIKDAVIYLDQPVSNSGRLKALILDMEKDYQVNVRVELLNDVDRVLYGKENVVTSDAIILDNCASWFNLSGQIIEQDIKEAWVYTIAI